LIYIGEFKNLRALVDLLKPLPVDYETFPWWHGSLTFEKNDSLVTLKTLRDWEESRFVTDLGILAHVPGQNDENYTIVAGFGYNAQIKIVEIITEKESLQQLEQQVEKQNGYWPDYFVMVFQVQGFDRASTTAEMHFFSAINKNDYLAAPRSTQ